MAAGRPSRCNARVEEMHAHREETERPSPNRAFIEISSARKRESLIGFAMHVDSSFLQSGSCETRAMGLPASGTICTIMRRCGSRPSPNRDCFSKQTSIPACVRHGTSIVGWSFFSLGPVKPGQWDCALVRTHVYHNGEMWLPSESISMSKNTFLDHIQDPYLVKSCRQAQSPA